MKKTLIMLAVSLLAINSPAMAEQDFDVESCQAGKAYFWSTKESGDDVGIINSTTKTRNIRIHVYDNSPNSITFSYPCENNQTELKPGQTVVCPLQPYYKGSGKGYLIVWSAKEQNGKPKAIGTLTVDFN